MLLSKLTLGTTKLLTRPEEILPTGALVQLPMMDRLASAWFCTLVRFKLSLGVCWAGLPHRCLTHRQRWVTAPRSGLTA
jgi:hypothetical protein